MAEKPIGNGDGKDHFEKTPLQSKKFLIFLISETTWKLLVGLMITRLWWADTITFWDAVIIIAMIITAGFVEAWALGGQAAVDRYVRVARITAGTLTGKGPGPDDNEGPEDSENSEDDMEDESA